MLVYENIAELYEMKGDYEKSLHYLNIAFKYKDIADTDYFPYLLYCQAKIYWKLNKIDEATELIRKGLMIAEKVSGIDKVIDLHFLNLEINMETKQSLENSLPLLEKLCRNNGYLSRLQ